MDATILWKIRGYIVIATLLTLGVFAGIGHLIDLYFKTSPKGLVISILLSFPVTNFLAIRLTKSKITST